MPKVTDRIQTEFQTTKSFTSMEIFHSDEKCHLTHKRMTSTIITAMKLTDSAFMILGSQW